VRELTEQESKEYRYSVFFTIDVKRTDNQMLTDAENAMVQQMKTATEQAIAKVMADSGFNNSKNLESGTRIY
jgi:hypothetical protein